MKFSHWHISICEVSKHNVRNKLLSSIFFRDFIEVSMEILRSVSLGGFFSLSFSLLPLLLSPQPQLFSHPNLILPIPPTPLRLFLLFHFVFVFVFVFLFRKEQVSKRWQPNRAKQHTIRQEEIPHMEVWQGNLVGGKNCQEREKEGEIYPLPLLVVRQKSSS